MFCQRIQQVEKGSVLPLQKSRERLQTIHDELSKSCEEVEKYKNRLLAGEERTAFLEKETQRKDLKIREMSNEINALNVKLDDQDAVLEM